MRRREFISILGGAMSWPLAARAQEQTALPLIAVLSPLSRNAATRNIAAFRTGLRDLGYVEGRNMRLEVRYGDGAPGNMPALAAELVALSPAAILAGSKSSILPLRADTRKIPIVMLTADDPVAAGLVQSIARPGGNITGNWILGGDGLVGKRLDFLKLVVPGLSHVGVILNPDDPTDIVTAKGMTTAAGSLGLSYRVLEFRNPADLAEVSAQIERSNLQGLLVGQGPTFNTRRAEIAEMVQHLRLPAVYGFREFVQAGGLMSYGPDLPDVYRQSARLIDKIVKGVSPADLPVEIPTRYELVVNLKTAKALGLTISESFLLLADEVIE